MEDSYSFKESAKARLNSTIFYPKKEAFTYLPSKLHRASI